MKAIRFAIDAILVLLVFSVGSLIRVYHPKETETPETMETLAATGTLETDLEERDWDGACRVCGKFSCCHHAPCLSCHWCLGVGTGY